MYIFVHIYIADEQGIEVKWIQFSVEMEIWYYIFFQNRDSLIQIVLELSL